MTEDDKRKFADRISKKVLGMTEDERDAYIKEHKLEHLADPEFLENLLHIAVTGENKPTTH